MVASFPDASWYISATTSGVGELWETAQFIGSGRGETPAWTSPIRNLIPFEMATRFYSGQYQVTYVYVFWSHPFPRSENASHTTRWSHLSTAVFPALAVYGGFMAVKEFNRKSPHLLYYWPNKWYTVYTLNLWLYSPCGPWSLFQILNLYTVGRTPWTGDQPIARSLPTHRTTQTQEEGI
jgi:hypothetical protein